MEKVSDQLQSLMTFDEKLNATILSYQRGKSALSATKRKRKKTCATPVGLSSPINEQDIMKIIENLDHYPFDDVMLLVWCKRIIFHNSEPTIDDNKSLTPPFFRYWAQLYLKKPDQVLSTHLGKIPKYGGWGDLKTMYTCACQMKKIFPDQLILLENLKIACLKIIGDQLKVDYQLVSQQAVKCSNEDKEAQLPVKTQDRISNCANEAPRISNNYKKSTTVMAKEIAQYLHPTSFTIADNDQQSSIWKGYAHENYRSLISTLCQTLDEQIKTKTPKDVAPFCTREKREKLLAGRLSLHVINPEPQPVVPCTLQQLEPLLEYLFLNKPGPSDDEMPVVFPRGTIMSGGRLDLCKQVVGPKGVEPLLNAMKQNSFVSRLLLGNNIVALPGAKAISQYIRCNTDSNIDTWYIGCNRFDSECISLISDALAVDKKVKALWLKRNPILATGIVHIARMLTTNRYLQTLDLLNTGLLDEGCQILLDVLKSNKTLKHLYIDVNGLTGKSALNIRLYFEQNDNHLESLYMSCNAFGDEGACQIAAGIKHDHRLRRLGLASNSIGPDGARALVDALIDHQTLQQLNLGYMKSTSLYDHLNNIIGDDGAAQISRLIQFNHQIRSIDLTLNGISQRGLRQLTDALNGNRTLTTLKGLSFKQVQNQNKIKKEIKTILQANLIEWGKQVLTMDTNHDTSLLSTSDYLKKGHELDHEINVPEHVMEVISHYRIN